MTAISWMLFDATGQDPDLLRHVEHKLREAAPSRPLVCSNCGQRISAEDLRIEISGAHSHSCTNPHGIVFRIGCFSRAPGCSTLGPASLEYTWFPGHRWQVAVCSNCQFHLGWRFRGEDNFYGLILARLRPGTD